MPIETKTIPIFWDPNAPTTGHTQVKVFRKEESGKIRQIHEGIVIQQTSCFVRVYNPLTPDAGGDLSAEMAQLFPVSSPSCWIEVIGYQEKPTQIPPVFR